MISGSPDLTKAISRRFKPKKIEFSTYEVDYKDVKGQLLVTGILTGVLEVPKSELPQGSYKPDLPYILVYTQAIISYINEGKKHPAGSIYTNEQLQKFPKEDITKLLMDSAHEPLNEYIVSGNPPISLTTRTTLVKVELIENIINNQGDPMFLVSSNTSQSVNIAKSGEAGSR